MTRMAFEYEALIGHLNVIGGRAVSAQPPGALVEVAPQRATRGREADTFFTLVLPAGLNIAPAAFYEQMAQVSAEKYFETAGSVTAALREVLTYLNQNLIDHNRTAQGRAVLADMVCAVLRGEDLIIARVGRSVAALAHAGRLDFLPEEPFHPMAEPPPPLGAQQLPDIKFTRHKVAAGSRLLLSDAPLSELNPERVALALSEIGLDMALVRMKENAMLQLALLAVEFVPPEMPAPQPVPEGESSKEVAAAIRSANNRPTERKRRSNATGVGFVFVVIGRVFGLIAGALARVLGLVSGGIEQIFGPSPEGEKRWYQSPLVAGVAVLMPVILVGLVVGLWLGGTGQTAFELCINEATELADVARGVPSSNPDGLRSTWNAVITAAGNCDTLRPGDETAAKLRAEGRDIIDTLNQVTRRDAKLLHTLEDAQFTRLLIQGLDVYLLDRSRSRVYATTLASDGVNLSRTVTPILSMSRGASVNGYAVGDFIDIAFASGTDQLFALDRAGVLVRCPRRQAQQCEALQLRGSENWVNPVAMVVWGPDDRIYILDVGANQIWRYNRDGGSYSGIATPYFDGQNQGALQTCVDFKIDADGSVFALRSDGVVIKYNRGQIQQFRLGGFPEGQEPRSGQSLMLDEDPIGQAIYVTSREGLVVHEMTLGGTFSANIKVSDERLFSALAGVVSNPSQRLLYVISGNALMVIQK